MEKEKLPQHVAVIPDGNRRWARERGLVPWEGHREGARRFREVSEAAFRMGIPYFTFWAASEDNLTKRSRVEVKFLVSLFRETLENKKLLEGLKKNDTRVRVIGRWNEILKDKKLAESIAEIEEKTGTFEKHRLTVLFGYDGRREMLEAIANLLNYSPSKQRESRDFQKSEPQSYPFLRQAQDKPGSGNNFGTINPQFLKAHLWTSDLPEVDLVIRTGGEPHWSAGFMMWLCADSQFYFTEKYWPDFDKEEFKKALADYKSRERRFGK